tara:strand:- start:77 stop:322 length:246 start_codon:yes stop_codon:yes gene_type:complete
MNSGLSGGSRSARSVSARSKTKQMTDQKTTALHEPTHNELKRDAPENPLKKANPIYENLNEAKEERVNFRVSILYLWFAAQ